jgi:hypothetical protein
MHERSSSVCRVRALLLITALLITNYSAPAAPQLDAFFESHCLECHDQETHKGNLDLSTLKREFSDPEAFARWVKVHDRVRSGEMPPKKKERPPAAEAALLTDWLHESLVEADRARVAKEGRAELRRLTRVEYENTIRDLFDLPGIALQNLLPGDGSAHGFDKLSDALDISHVNLAKYMEAADRALDMAIATQPQAPTVTRQHLSLASSGNVQGLLLQGDAVLLKEKAIDPNFPAAGEAQHLSHAAHNAMASFSTQSSVGLFRHEEAGVQPYYTGFATLYPGRYRIRAPFWSFHWQKGKILPSRGTEAARLSAVQLGGSGHGSGSNEGSRVLEYFDAPSIESQVHEFETWLNFKETIGFNPASLAPVSNYNRPGHAMAFDGPCVVSDGIDLEGPLNEMWPPRSHRRLFGELPLQKFEPAEHPGMQPPPRHRLRQEIGYAQNLPDDVSGLWTVASEHPLEDADRLLAAFLPKAFRRPVAASVRQQYVAQVEHWLQAGDCFESAMRWVYRAALCSPNFLYRVETPGHLNDFALASRLSYLLWNSMPDDALTAVAAAGTLHEPAVLRGETERLLKDPRSQRFIEDFLGQWLRLREVAANDPDRKLYPEFSPYLLDSMRGETLAYFRELLERDLDATYLVRSDFALLNQKLAAHYGVPGVVGTKFRRVALPAECPRGGFLTQAAILKITANGTTTSPIVRGAFVMGRLLGQPPEPPPPNTPALEPDVRGATTIRAQLDQHRSQPACAACHVNIDPPGFALESFDVIGGWRTRYRSIGEGDAPERGALDPFINLNFKLGLPVDPSGALADGRKFADIRDLQSLLAANPARLLENLARQFAVYATGHEITFSDRDEIAGIVARAQQHGGGIRTLLHELIDSPLFQTK